MTTSSSTIIPHLTDSIIRPFTASTFSPINYLNTTLPAANATKQQAGGSPLSTTASLTQSHISTLNAQLTRLSQTLTNLTDDILRTSSRLAYEVELLRGEAVSLADSLSSKGDLHGSIIQFVPGGLDENKGAPSSPLSPIDAQKSRNRKGSLQSLSTGPQDDPKLADAAAANEPEALARLRTLLQVRAQLQRVTQQFNFALSFPFPPSLLTTAASSLISVNPPNVDPTLESKGQAAISRLRQEVLDLLIDIEGRGGGVERARNRVKELREICTIWKGTGEEKARLKWVDGLNQMIDDEVRKKEESRQRGVPGKQQPPRENSAVRNAGDAGGSGSGFLSRLRGEIYME